MFYVITAINNSVVLKISSSARKSITQYLWFILIDYTSVFKSFNNKSTLIRQWEWSGSAWLSLRQRVMWGHDKPCVFTSFVVVGFFGFFFFSKSVRHAGWGPEAARRRDEQRQWNQTEGVHVPRGLIMTIMMKSRRAVSTPPAGKWGHGKDRPTRCQTNIRDS